MLAGLKYRVRRKSRGKRYDGEDLEVLINTKVPPIYYMYLIKGRMEYKESVLLLPLSYSINGSLIKIFN